MSGTHPCPSCGKPVPDEREELLGVRTCIACTRQPPKPRGVMIYDHKTAGALHVCRSEEEFRKIKGHNDPSKDGDLEDFTP